MIDMNPVEIFYGTGDKVIVTFSPRTPLVDDRLIGWGNMLKTHYKILIAFADPNGTWYTDPHWENTVREALNPYNSVDVAIGSSMGGWGVLYYKDLLKTNSIRAFSPQSYVNKEKWCKIGPIHHEWAQPLESSIDLKLCNSNNIDIVTAFGVWSEDLPHKNIMISQGFHIINVKSENHVITHCFKKQGKMFNFLFDK